MKTEHYWQNSHNSEPRQFRVLFASAGMAGSLNPSFLERSLLDAGPAPPPSQSPTSHPPPNNSSTPPAFELRLSGRCLMYITTSADCATAARALGVEDTTVEEERSYGPPGCYYKGGRLKMNRVAGGMFACSSARVPER